VKDLDSPFCFKLFELGYAWGKDLTSHIKYTDKPWIVIELDTKMINYSICTFNNTPKRFKNGFVEGNLDKLFNSNIYTSRETLRRSKIPKNLDGSIITTW